MIKRGLHPQVRGARQHALSERQVRAMLERATSFEPNAVEGRFMIHVRYLQRPWIATVEPEADDKLLVVVTVYEVSE